MAQGGRQKVWVLLTMFFVKHTNQGEFLKLYLMLKSEERWRQNASNESCVKRKKRATKSEELEEKEEETAVI